MAAGHPTPTDPHFPFRSVSQDAGSDDNYTQLGRWSERWQNGNQRRDQKAVLAPLHIKFAEDPVRWSARCTFKDRKNLSQGLVLSQVSQGHMTV